MSATILNTDSNINAKTVMAAENAETVTGLKTFDRDPNPPFAVSSGSAVVPNLIAERASTADAPTSGQFAFPAAQNASSGANTLDDYEEGTWTMVLASSGGGTPTYSTQTGYYTKIGRLVTVTGYLQLATTGTLAAGDLTITGLPFAPANLTNNYAPVNVSYYAQLASDTQQIGGFIAPNTTVISLVRNGSPAARTLTSTMTVADINGTFQIIFSASYHATT